MPYKQEQIHAAREFLKKKTLQRHSKYRKLWKLASADAEKIKKHIIQNYNTKRIIQWGSILKPEYFREYSDIDFAVEGLSDLEFFHLFRTAEEQTNFTLHFIRWEELPNYYQEHLLLLGQVVYERK
ncbi:MAG: nucleotidyltransferase domain-containing protein [Chthoniobacterales bacterium]|nr:nucleotidyltransferase domain-containing protein [Chthoniobacterales bacterium]